MGKTNALRNKISSFQQQDDEWIPEAWEQMQEYVTACQHHGMEDWLLIQNIYHGLVSLESVGTKNVSTHSKPEGSS